MTDVREVIARALLRERHPCWSIVDEIMRKDSKHYNHDGQANEMNGLANAVIAALTEAGVLPQWRPIESAPHGETVLLGWLCSREGKWIMEAGPASSGQRYEGGFSSVSYHGSATHWMPLPTPPETNNDG